MKITCGSCGAKYTVSDEKVHGKTVKVKCRKCGAVIVVSSTGEVQTTGAGGSQAGPAPTGASYTVSVSDTDQRTMTLAQIIDAYNEGTIDAETFVWAEGMDDWQPLKDVDAIVDGLHDAASTEGGELGQTVAMHNPSESPGSYRPPASYPPVGSYPPAPAQGLGGTVAMAQSPMAQSPMGGGGMGGGGGGGFFAASPGGSFGGSSFTDVAAPAPGGNGQPRTEDSAIFSLNMLTSKVGGTGSTSTAPSSSGSPTTSEDSGLIDLKALAQGMGNESSTGAASAPAPMAAEGLFPLGAPPPQALAPAASISVAPPGGSTGRGLILGLAALVVVMGAALMFILVRDSGEQPTTTPSAAPVSTPTPTPAITEDTPEPEPKVTASASASASAAPKVAGGPRPQGGARPQTGPRPQPGSAPAPAPKAAGGPCGCSSDDLMCHMRCSQKGKK